MRHEKNIFKVEVNEKGAESFRRIHPLVKLIFWISLAVHFAPLIYYLIRFPELLALRRAFDSPFTLRLLIYPTYLLLMIITNLLFYYYFLRFSRRAKDSIANGDSTGFNDSLQWMHKALLFTLFSLVFNGIFTFFMFLSNRY